MRFNCHAINKFRWIGALSVVKIKVSQGWAEASQLGTTKMRKWVCGGEIGEKEKQRSSDPVERGRTGDGGKLPASPTSCLNKRAGPTLQRRAGPHRESILVEDWDFQPRHHSNPPQDFDFAHPNIYPISPVGTCEGSGPVEPKTQDLHESGQ